MWNRNWWVNGLKSKIKGHQPIRNYKNIVTKVLFLCVTIPLQSHLFRNMYSVPKSYTCVHPMRLLHVFTACAYHMYITQMHTTCVYYMCMHTLSQILNTCARHSCSTLLLDTCAQQSCLHSCLTLMFDTRAWHSCLTLVLDTRARHSCSTLVFATRVRHSCLGLMLIIIVIPIIRRWTVTFVRLIFPFLEQCASYIYFPCIIL